MADFANSVSCEGPSYEEGGVEGNVVMHLCGEWQTLDEPFCRGQVKIQGAHHPAWKGRRVKVSPDRNNGRSHVMAGGEAGYTVCMNKINLVLKVASEVKNYFENRKFYYFGCV